MAAGATQAPGAQADRSARRRAQERLPPGAPRMKRKRLSLRATFGAVGVVFGDIGTSPLYALEQSLNATGPERLSPPVVLGVLSLIFWSLLIVVAVKYVILIMRADNAGEGGILSLFALVQ